MATLTMAEKAARAMLMAYLRRECPALFRPGIVFTAEQQAAIRAMPRDQATETVIGVLRPEEAPA